MKPQWRLHEHWVSRKHCSPESALNRCTSVLIVGDKAISLIPALLTTFLEHTVDCGLHTLELAYRDMPDINSTLYLSDL